MKHEKPKTIAIIEVKKTRRHIFVHYRKGEEDFKIRSNENPLPAFHAALNALAPVALTVAELPDVWAKGFVVHGMTIGEMRDVRTVQIRGKKEVAQSGVMLAIDTPPALLATPQTEGIITPPLIPAHVDAVEEMIEAAKAYALGKRAQGTLALDEDADEDEGDPEVKAEATPPLPGIEPAKAKRKASKK